MSIENDMKELMALPSFRKFLFRLIQTAGILSTANPSRDLAFAEGRKSLALVALHEAEQALAPEQRHPDNVMTLLSLLREAAQTKTDNKPKARKDDDDGLYDDD